MTMTLKSILDLLIVLLMLVLLWVLTSSLLFWGANKDSKMFLRLWMTAGVLLMAGCFGVAWSLAAGAGLQ